MTQQPITQPEQAPPEPVTQQPITQPEQAPPEPVVEPVAQQPLTQPEQAPPEPVVEPVAQQPITQPEQAPPEPVVAQHTPDIEVLWEEIPDPSVTVEQCIEYGYTEMADLHPLKQEKALELFEGDLTIYALNQDNTETMMFDVEEIGEHKGLFAVEKTDWNKYCNEEPVAEATQQEVIPPVAEVKEENQAPEEQPTAPEPVAEEKPRPTVADYEEAVNNGEAISILGLAQAVQREREMVSKTTEKPSILAQLKASKQGKEAKDPAQDLAKATKKEER